MNKLFLSLFSIFVCTLYGQSTKFVYSYLSISDSTDINSKNEDTMLLTISNDKSYFYSQEKFSKDSLRFENEKKGIMEPLKNKIRYTDRIIKFSNTSEIVYLSTIGINTYFIQQNINLKWDLKQEFDLMLGYKVQKATTEFGGRQWEAWFSQELPFQDGPYKFNGLPGLIFRIEDVQKYHIFQLVEINKNDKNFYYPDEDSFTDYPKININQYIKQFRNFRENPIADLIGKIPDQIDQNGNLKSGNEILNEVRRKEVERLKKDNNIIEINLLKK